MAHAEIAWLAGIFEGEGNLTACLTKRRRCGFHLTVQASLVNTDPAIIDEVVRISTERGLIPFVVWRQPKNHPNWKVRGEIWWYGQRRVLQLCYLIGDFLKGEKKHKATKLITFLEDRMVSPYHAKTNLELFEPVLSKGRKQKLRFLELQERKGRLYA